MPRSTCKDQVPAFPGVSKVCSMDLGNTKLPVFPGVSKACTMTFTCIPGCFPACFSRDRSQMQADCLTTGEVPTAYSVKILSRTKGMASGSTTTSPLQVKGQSSSTQHKLFYFSSLSWCGFHGSRAAVQRSPARVQAMASPTVNCSSMAFSSLSCRRTSMTWSLRGKRGSPRER